MSAAAIVYESPQGYITIERTGKSRSYIVYKHEGTAAIRWAVFGLGATDAFERAKGRLISLTK